ncbi:MAG: hypothetical protein ACRDHE_07165 [Ktedonobacterales bacterium]
MGPTEYEYRQALAWIEHLRTRVAQLETENAHLRLQLDELRRGVGVAVVIQGQAIPLAPLSRQPSAMTGSQPVPAPRSQPSGSISAPVPPVFPPAAPLSAPLGAAPSGPCPTPYAENTWLTGPTPAVSPVSPQRGPAHAQGQRSAGQQRQGRPSQRMTPEWLRDDSPNGANNQPSPTQYGPDSRSTGQIPAVGPRGASTNGQPRPRGGVPARPLGGQQSGDRLPSLAELTGHIPAVRGRAKQARRDHEAYDDSFVLG